jgi:hypothetical protein
MAEDKDRDRFINPEELDDPGSKIQEVPETDAVPYPKPDLKIKGKWYWFWESIPGS